MLFVDASTDSIGIGTSSINLTAADRTVVEIDGTTSTVFSNSIGGTNKFYIYSHTDGSNIKQEGYLRFSTGGANERMRILADGKVGIGTDSPAYLLDVAGTADVNNLLINTAQGSDGQVLTSTGSGVAWEAASGGNIASASDCTISSSDPAADTNPSAVGHLWLNSTSGEAFICTDATTDQNDWTNIGPGTGDIMYTSATGGTITTTGGYTYHTFTSSGNFVVTGTLACEWAIVAGGGSSARAPNIATGGGGAGGFIDSSGTLAAATYPVVIGAGGASYSSADGGGNNGSNTTFNSLTAIGGGTSGYYSGDALSPPAYVDATAGGSGGGASWNGNNNTTEGAGTSGQGNAGGPSGAPEYDINEKYLGNGGGGKGAQGGDVQSSTLGGNGGIGLDWKSLGTYYAGGGGGGPGGTGGNGGGATAIANSASGNTTGQPGTVNTGGGGSGAKGTGYNTNPSYPSGAGGSGIVIIRYQI